MARSKITTAASRAVNITQKPAAAASAATPAATPVAAPTAARMRGRSGKPDQASISVVSAPKPVAAAETAPASKQAGIVAALRRSQGATIAELMQLTGWLSHSVRGVLSGALKRKLGLVVDSRLEPGRGRVYRIVPPAHAEKVVETGTVSPPAKAHRTKPRGSAAQAPA